MIKSLRAGFTIVEMMVVLAVIGVLLGIVATAATSAIRDAREKRAQTMAATLQAGLSTYYTQNGKWPQTMESRIESAGSGTVTLKDSEADAVFRELVTQSVGGGGGGGANPLVDVSGLFVANASGISGGHAYGTGFNEALMGDAHRAKLSISQMAFGYPERSSGHFRRFTIVYNVQADSVSVNL